MAIIAHGELPLFLPSAIEGFGPEGCFSLAIIAFGAFGFIVPRYDFRLGSMDKRGLDTLTEGGYGLQGLHEIIAGTPPPFRKIPLQGMLNFCWPCRGQRHTDSVHPRPAKRYQRGMNSA